MWFKVTLGQGTVSGEFAPGHLSAPSAVIKRRRSSVTETRDAGRMGQDPTGGLDFGHGLPTRGPTDHDCATVLDKFEIRAVWRLRSG